MNLPKTYNLIDKFQIYMFCSVLFILSIFSPTGFMENKSRTIYILASIILIILSATTLIQKKSFTPLDRWMLFLWIIFFISAIKSINIPNSIKTLAGFTIKGFLVAFIAQRLNLNSSERETPAEEMTQEEGSGWLMPLLTISFLFSLLSIPGLLSYWGIIHSNKIIIMRLLPDWLPIFPTGNPLVAGAFNVLFIPLAILNCRYKKSFTAYLYLIVICAAIFLSFSRSGYLATIIASGLFLTLYGKKHKINFSSLFKKFSYLIFIILILISAIYFIGPKGKFSISSALGSTSLKHRINSYVVTWEIIRRKPLLGIGLGNYPEVHTRYVKYGVEEMTPTPDNMYLRFFIETGVTGGGIFILFLIYLIKYLWLNRMSSHMITAILAGIAGFAINMFSADLMLWSATQAAFWTLLGISGSIISKPRWNQKTVV